VDIVYYSIHKVKKILLSIELKLCKRHGRQKDLLNKQKPQNKSIQGFCKGIGPKTYEAYDPIKEYSSHLQNQGFFMSNKTAQMKQEALSIHKKLQSLDAEEVKAAMGEYLNLVDRFYQENEHLMTPQQYEAAKKDYEYFMRLIALAGEYRKEG